MGTSSSAAGSGPKSPLIPPGTDATPGAPIPVAVPNRFQAFRTSFGGYVEGGGGTGRTLKSALGKYARTSTGGSDVGPRRFGPAYQSGGGLFALLGEMQAGGNGSASVGIDLSRLIGRSVAFAAQEIAKQLAPDGIDADRIAVAMNEALSEVLPDQDVFDPAQMTAEQIVAVLVEYLSRILFHQVTEDASSAWNRAPSDQRTIEAENELSDLIKIAMDRHLGPKLADGVGRLSRAEVEQAQMAAMKEVWREWERFE